MISCTMEDEESQQLLCDSARAEASARSGPIANGTAGNGHAETLKKLPAPRYKLHDRLISGARKAGLLLVLLGALVLVARKQHLVPWPSSGPSPCSNPFLKLPDMPATTRPIRKAQRIGPEQAHPEVRPGVNYSELLMPAFHISSPHGTWMNDANGLLDLGGMRHVFYQHNPAAPKWGPMHWGHCVSRDLVKWMRLPVAMSPSSWWDQDGVFSGSAGIKPDGTPFLMYTGVTNFSDLGFFFSTQATAVPTNFSDPLLSSWTKQEPLSMDIPPGGTRAQFRDPTTPWTLDRTAARSLFPDLFSDPSASEPSARNQSRIDQEGTGPLWFTAVGTLQDCVGCAALYASEDFRTWTYAGALYSQLSQNSSEYAQCLDNQDDVPYGTKGFGGTCDQFGSHCRMWECPDYFKLESASHVPVQVFKFSDQMRHRPTFAADWYVLSDSLGLNLTSASLQQGRRVRKQDLVVPSASDLGSGHDAFVAQLAGRPFAPRLLDYGAVYASKTMQMQDGRIVWMAWVYEDSLGCTELCNEGSPFILNHQQWQGLQSLPRLVTYDPTSYSLVLFPVSELVGLRGQALGGEAGWNVTLPAHTQASSQGGGRAQLIPEEHQPDPGPKRRHMEVRASFGLEALTWQPGMEDHASASFQAGVILRTGNGSYTRVYLRGVAAYRVNASDSGSGISSTIRGAGPQPGATLWPVVQELHVVVDRTYSGGATQSNMNDSQEKQVQAGDLGLAPGSSWQGGAVDLPAGGVLAAAPRGGDQERPWGADAWGGSSSSLPLSLALWVDASVIEAFALGGHARVSTRIYPFESEWAWGLDVFGDCSVAAITGQVQAYSLESCWVDSL